MKLHKRHHKFGAPGATMLLVLMLTVVGGIGVTAWMYLIAARLIQVERMNDSVSRRIVQCNSGAINQQYQMTFAYRDSVTQPQVSALLSNSWGGVIENGFISLQSFRSGYTYSNPPAYSYAYNNTRYVPTGDGSVFFARVTATTDGSQPETLSYYNFLKSFPRSLLGDLLYVHTKPAGASGAAYITKNLYVNGRVLVYDSTGNIAGVDADECLNLTKTGTNTTLNSSGSTALLPENYPSIPIFSQGSVSTSSGAVLDGSLNMCNNANFTPSSIYHILRTLSPGYYTMTTAATPASMTSGANLDNNNNGGVSGTTKNGGSATSDIWVKVDDHNPPIPNTSTFTPPTTSPYGYTWAKGNSAVSILLKSASLYHVHLQTGPTMLVLQGQTTSADYTAAASLAPVVILVEPGIKDIRFVGENSRPLILALGNGSGGTTFMSWSGTNSATSGGPLRWKLNLINQYNDVWLDPPPSGGTVRLTGSIRTNWNINCTDATTTNRFTLMLDATPGALVSTLPRDAWFEPVVIR